METSTTEEVASQGAGPNPILEAALDYANAAEVYQKARYLDPEQEAANAKLVSTREALLALVGESKDLGVLLELDTTRNERDALHVRNADLALELERKTARNAQLINERGDALHALGMFKDRVVEVAGRYADEHDVCSVVDDALRELGLERPKVMHRGTLTINVEFEGELESGKSIPNARWVRDSIRVDTDAIEGVLEFDSDHVEGTITDTTFEFSNIRSAD